MSAEPERLYSHSKTTLSDRRNRLGADILEALECLKSWLKIADKEGEVLEGLLDSLSDGLMGKDYVKGDGEG